MNITHSQQKIFFGEPCLRVAVLCATFLLSLAASAQSQPTVTNVAAAALRPGQATLTGRINPNQLHTSYWFEHGLFSNYGKSTPTNTLAPGTNLVDVSNLITSLPRGGSYNFRLVASNSLGRVTNANVSFFVPVGTTTSSGSAGLDQPFDLHQPSLELNYIICTSGNYPNPGGSVEPPFLGEVRLFAGNFAPLGWAFCHGQLLSVIDDPLFNVIGTIYGGDGENTFALPDLRGRTVVGSGDGPEGITRVVGESGGDVQRTLTQTHLAFHSHPLPYPDFASGITGVGDAYPNMQPYLVMSALFRIIGNFPYPDQPASDPMLAQFSLFAGNYSLNGLPFAAGQFLPINQYQDLYSVILTNYGGNGTVSFAIPNLKGRTPMHIGAGPGPHTWAIAQQTGLADAVIKTVSLPTHQHTATSLGINTGSTGDGQPHSLMQPSLAIRYLIATNGYFPSSGDPSADVPAASGGSVVQMLAQINLFAGTVTPQGWLPCEGQVLLINQHTALFSLLGTTYGGNGINNFALPDLSSRIPVGSIDGICGAFYGAQEDVLTTAQMPAHTHVVPKLDFDRWITSFNLNDAAAGFETDADGDGLNSGFEWATGTNPTNANSAARLGISLAGQNVTVRFPRNTNATDLRLSLQRNTALTSSNVWTGLVTNNLGVWIPPAVPVSVNETGATNPVNVGVSDSRTNLPAANYRLRVEWP